MLPVSHISCLFLRLLITHYTIKTVAKLQSVRSDIPLTTGSTKFLFSVSYKISYPRYSADYFPGNKADGA